MRKHKRLHNAGLTLMETLISSALLAIFSIFIVNIVVVTQKAWTIEHTAVPVRAEAKKTIEVISKELREGDPSAPGGVAIGGSGNSQTITFSVPNQVSDSSISSWRQVQFTHDVGQNYVNRTSSDTGTTTIGRNINLLQFSQANNIVTTTIRATKATPEGTNLQTTLSSQVRLRN